MAEIVREGATARVVLVSGMSGAGKSSTLRALEDLGYEAVDNLPLNLLPSLLKPSAPATSALAIGIDTRTRDFNPERFVAIYEGLPRGGGTDVSLVFLDCDDEVLRRRFTETRRRHPLAGDRPVSDGIRRERRLVSALKDSASLTVDTSELPLARLRQIIEAHFSLGTRSALAVFVTSFAFRRGLPRDADIVLDVRFLTNPHYVDELRPLTGLHPDVAAHVSSDPDFEAFFGRVTGLLLPLLPRYDAEGKRYLTVAVGCTGGRHRSVFVAERLAAEIGASGFPTRIGHRDIDAGIE